MGQQIRSHHQPSTGRTNPCFGGATACRRILEPIVRTSSAGYPTDFLVFRSEGFSAGTRVAHLVLGYPMFNKENHHGSPTISHYLGGLRKEDTPNVKTPPRIPGQGFAEAWRPHVPCRASRRAPEKRQNGSFLERRVSPVEPFDCFRASICLRTCFVLPCWF